MTRTVHEYIIVYSLLLAALAAALHYLVKEEGRHRRGVSFQVSKCRSASRIGWPISSIEQENFQYNNESTTPRPNSNCKRDLANLLSEQHTRTRFANMTQQTFIARRLLTVALVSCCLLALNSATCSATGCGGGGCASKTALALRALAKVSGRLADQVPGASSRAASAVRNRKAAAAAEAQAPEKTIIMNNIRIDSNGVGMPPQQQPQPVPLDRFGASSENSNQWNQDNGYNNYARRQAPTRDHYYQPGIDYNNGAHNYNPVEPNYVIDEHNYVNEHVHPSYYTGGVDDYELGYDEGGQYSEQLAPNYGYDGEGTHAQFLLPRQQQQDYLPRHASSLPNMQQQQQQHQQVNLQLHLPPPVHVQPAPNHLTIVNIAQSVHEQEQEQQQRRKQQEENAAAASSRAGRSGGGGGGRYRNRPMVRRRGGGRGCRG